jgi:hypothetical protein
MIAYAASDLIWGARIKSTFLELGIACVATPSIDRLGDQLVGSDLAAVIVDLDRAEKAIEMIQMVRKHEQEHHPGRRVYVLAFGPHVEKELFEQAREAGADEVLPRGAFGRSLPDILSRLSAGS